MQDAELEHMPSSSSSNRDSAMAPSQQPGSQDKQNKTQDDGSLARGESIDIAKGIRIGRQMIAIENLLKAKFRKYFASEPDKTWCRSMGERAYNDMKTTVYEIDVDDGDEAVATKYHHFLTSSKGILLDMEICYEIRVSTFASVSCLAKALSLDICIMFVVAYFYDTNIRVPVLARCGGLCDDDVARYIVTESRMF